ncbi:flippase [Thermogymnomonas acidicola]|uniref:flippase n=1 Tax=Thermogymnomonas acidicola TaxID=399579 RepID=UPI001E49C0D2|nr:flippase [Thermogymnomonas acidicola]
MPHHTGTLGIDALFQYTGSGVQLFSGTVFYIVLVRFFSTAQVGAVAVFVAIVGLFNLLFSFGLGTAVQHFTSYHLGRGDMASAKHSITRILTLGFLLSFAGLASMVALAPYLSVLFMHTAYYTELIRLLSVVLVGNILFGILNGASLGLQLFRTSGIMNMVIWSAYYIIAFVLALLGHSLTDIVAGWGVGIFTGVLVYLRILIKFLRSSDVSYPVSRLTPSLIFQYSVPVLFSSVISYGATYADRFIVAGLMSLSALGIYNFTLLVATSMGFLVSPLNNILLPKFSEFYGEGNLENVRERSLLATKVITGAYVPAALGVAVLSNPIMTLLAGRAYDQGADALTIIMVVGALFVSTNVMTQIIAAIRKTRVFLYSSVGSLLSNLMISIFLIPRFGMVGAATGFSSVYAVTFFVLYYFTRRTRMFRLEWKSTLKIWASSILMALAVLGVEMHTGSRVDMLPLYILLGAAIYVILFRLMRAMSPEDASVLYVQFPKGSGAVRRILMLLVSGFRAQ